MRAQSQFVILQPDNPPQNYKIITMRTCIVFALFVAVAVAAPVDPKTTTILRYENDNIGVDGFKYGFENSDGTSADESGVLKNVGTENEAIEVRGQYSYVGPDGVTYSVTYVANELGFQPSGAHIPQA